MKDVRFDIIWILLISTLSFIVTGLLFGFTEWTKPVDLQVHDTYYILSKGKLFLFLLLNFNFWIFLIRQSVTRFKRLSGNIILLIVTSVLIFITSLTIRYFTVANQGWTIYPPLSAISDYPIETTSNIFPFSPILQFYELFQIGILCLVGIMTGRGIEKASN